MLKREIYEKGQVVIPKNLRELTGLKPYTEVIFTLEGKKIIIQKAVSVADEFEKMAESAKISKTDLKGLTKERESGIKERLRGMKIDVS